jgi:hypothetical protein
MLHIISPLDTQKFSAQSLKGSPSDDYSFLTDLAKEKNAVFLVSDTCGSVPQFNAHWAVKYLKSIMIDSKIYFIVSDASDVEHTAELDQLQEYRLHKKIEKIIRRPIKFFHFYKNKNANYFDLPNLQHISSKHYLSKFETKFRYKISCLNNRFTKSRLIISCALLNLDSYITFNDKIYPHESKIPNIKNLNTNRNKLIQLFSTTKYSTELYTRNKTKESINLIKDSFCNVVTESPFFCKWPRFSEKTLKPMQAARPFVLISPVGSLQWLHENGFRSFSQWWDESYDLEPDHYVRIEKVYKVLEDINQLSTSDCVSMLNDMQDVLEHNQQHLQIYSKNMLRRLAKK